jgi:hypothetical protein
LEQGDEDTVASHFNLMKKYNLTSAAYLNYEAMHHTENADYFLESTLFKRSLIAIGHNDPRVNQWTRTKVLLLINFGWPLTQKLVVHIRRVFTSRATGRAKAQ